MYTCFIYTMFSADMLTHVNMKSAPGDHGDARDMELCVLCAEIIANEAAKTLRLRLYVHQQGQSPASRGSSLQDWVGDYEL